MEAPNKKTALRAAARWVLSLVRSPWLILTIPLTIGGHWLVLHPEIILSNLDKPYVLLAGPAFVGSLVLVWFLFTFFKAIAALCQKAWNSFCVWYAKPGSMFWIIINIFLLVSVSESGNYFDGLLGSNDMYGVLGYAVAFVIDLVAIQSMQARLGASRMRDKQGERLYQLGVFACAGLSAWANTYAALEHFQAPTGATHLPQIMITIAPWTGMAFPLLIIFLSFTADYTADQTNSKLDFEAFKQAEDERTKLLEYQVETRAKRREYELQMDALNGKISKREFFLLRRFFPVKQQQDPVAPAIDYTALVDLLKPHLEQIKSSLTVDLKPAPVALDYRALAKAVAPHLEARSTEPDLKPVVLDLTRVALTKNQVDLSPVVLDLTRVASSPVALKSEQVDLSPVELALGPVALAPDLVASSPVPPKEPPVKARSSGSQVDLTSGSELEKSSRAGSESTKEPLKSSNEERDQKLAAAYAELIAEGVQVSGRTLAGRAKCARPAANEWLQVHRSSGSGTITGGSESSSGPGSDTSGLEASGPGSDTSGPGSEVSGSKSRASGSGSKSSGPGSDTSGSDEVDLKPRSQVRNTDELMALDLEVSNA